MPAKPAVHAGLYAEMPSRVPSHAPWRRRIFGRLEHRLAIQRACRIERSRDDAGIATGLGGFHSRYRPNHDILEAVTVEVLAHLVEHALGRLIRYDAELQFGQRAVRDDRFRTVAGKPGHQAADRQPRLEQQPFDRIQAAHPVRKLGNPASASWRSSFHGIAAISVRSRSVGGTRSS